ncbi:hypothetical protein ABK905_06560 [Acerihabitans sp. KWT182]|uniref:Uncharacterized protein n=1 Tax=Acerihabitans sp. KWT182 TaxID=3157919 RepID=A0AAU7QBZ9_9GAMM
MHKFASSCLRQRNTAMSLARFAHESRGLLGRLDSRVKTLVILSAVAVASMLSQWYLALALWLAAISLFTLMPCDGKALFKRLMMPLGIAWLVFFKRYIYPRQHALINHSVPLFFLWRPIARAWFSALCCFYASWRRLPW